MIQTAQLEQQEVIAEALLACPVQSPVELQVLAGSHIFRLRSRLIGIDPPHCLILRQGHDQSWQDARHCLESGQPVILRMVNEIGQCQLLAFRTELGASTVAPRRWLTVKYPEIIESANMRQTKRIRVKFPCYLEWGGTKKNLGLGNITDLSSNGCRIVTNLREPLEDGSEITVRFKGDYSQLALPGIVRNNTTDTKGNILHGIQFQELEPLERGGLSEIMLANY